MLPWEVNLLGWAGQGLRGRRAVAQLGRGSDWREVARRCGGRCLGGTEGVTVGVGSNGARAGRERSVGMRERVGEIKRRSHGHPWLSEVVVQVQGVVVVVPLRGRRRMLRGSDRPHL